jgi:segregation and condensation protein B
LKSLDELPPLAEIKDIEEFDPQLTLGPIAPAPREHDGNDELSTDDGAANDESADSTEEHSA